MRGINVGGKNRLPMKDLAAIFEQAGCTDVRTYIQSGNVVFAAAPSAAGAVPARVQREVEAAFGIRSPVITRTARELASVLRAVPFSGAAADESRLHVAFLAGKPTPARAASLDPQRSPGDTFQLVGREVYLSLPNGVARTKLTNDYLDSTLGTVSTVRNWRTVTRLAGMLGVGG
jgi:uncharacterized protein (DUF1697 family)